MNAFIISGPSCGVGKDTLIDLVHSRYPDIVKAKNWTTRSKRSEESDEIYNFVTRDVFEEERILGNFMEHAEFDGHYYGSHAPSIHKQLAEDLTVIMRIDVQGHALVKREHPDIRSIFILPPSMKELEKRIQGRAQDDAHTIQRRLDLAKTEIARCIEYDYMIVNDDVFEAAAKLARFMRSSPE